MAHATRIGRLAGLAVGLGIGAAPAATPGVVSADPDPLPPFDPSDFAISVDGFTLFHEGTAIASSGFGDIAIADGAHSDASANLGIGNFASADGTMSVATASSGSFDSATAVGGPLPAVGDPDRSGRTAPDAHPADRGIRGNLVR
jgi:hypothetical protein